MNTLLNISSPVVTRLRSLVGIGAFFVPALVALPAHAQDAQVNQPYEELQRSIDIFSGVLREALGLNNRAGLFNPLSGSVDGMYLAEQGIVLEIIAPLSNRRTQFGPDSFTYSLQGFQDQFPGFPSTRMLRIPRPDIEAMRESMAMSLRAEALEERYRDVMESIAEMDLASEVENALRDATQSAASLRSFGQLDQEQFDAMIREANEVRQQLGEQMLELQELRNSVTARVNSGEAIDDMVAEQWRESLEALRENVEPLRAEAIARAAELQERSERSRLEREQQWQQDLVAFESNLYSVICDYSAALRALPADEHLTIVLKGVGEETDERREDRVHVVQKAQMQRCLLGEITPAELQTGAQRYSF